MAKYDSYVICTSPRSGSTLLCLLLRATGRAGNPESYFHQPSVEKWLESLGEKPPFPASEREVLELVFQSAITKGSLNTGIFGLRLQRPSFKFLIKQLTKLHPHLSGDEQKFEKVFGRTCFIHLTRHNKVAQAVSLLKAEQTGLWHVADDGSELERQSPPENPFYDPIGIRDRVNEVTAYDQQWIDWFAVEKINPFRIVYEDLSADPLKALKQILGHMEIDCENLGDIKPGVSKLADKTSQEWVERFRSEYPLTC